MEWNPAAERTFGHARAEVIGRSLPELIIPPALREAHRNGLQHYLATGEGPFSGQRIEVPALHADGHEFPVELAVTAIEGAGRRCSAPTCATSASRRRPRSLWRRTRASPPSSPMWASHSRASDSMDEILQTCTEALVTHLDAAFARIWTLNELDDVLELQASAGMDTDLDGESRVPSSRTRHRAHRSRHAAARRPPDRRSALGRPGVGRSASGWSRSRASLSSSRTGCSACVAMYRTHPLSRTRSVRSATVADALALGVKRKRAEDELERAKEAAEEASRTRASSWRT